MEWIDEQLEISIVTLNNEITDSVKERFLERISDPFLGSFIIFYFVVHWQKFIILILDEKKIEEKIELFNQAMGGIVSFIWPVILTVFYFFVYPWIKKWIIHYRVRRELDIEHQNTVLKKQSIQSYPEYIQREEELNQQITSIQQNFEALFSFLKNKCYPSDEFDLFHTQEKLSLGDWVCDEKEGPKSLGYRKALAPDDKVDGIVLEVINNNYCVVQKGGSIENVGQISQDLVPEKVTTTEEIYYRLSETKAGKAEEFIPDSLEDSHILGRYYKERNIFIFGVNPF